MEGEDTCYTVVFLCCTGTDAVPQPVPVLALNQGEATSFVGDPCNLSYKLLSQLLNILKGIFKIFIYLFVCFCFCLFVCLFVYIYLLFISVMCYQSYCKQFGQ